MFLWSNIDMFWRIDVATISRLLKIIGLFCKRALEKRLYSAKETYSFKEPANRSHPISLLLSKIVMFWRIDVSFSSDKVFIYIHTHIYAHSLCLPSRRTADVFIYMYIYTHRWAIWSPKKKKVTLEQDRGDSCIDVKSSSDEVWEGTHTHTHTLSHTHMSEQCVFIHTYTHTHIYTHTYIHTHV